MASTVNALRDRLVSLRFRLGPLVALIPARWRAKVVQNLSSELLIQAIGNLESRDELFWLRRQVWDLSHRLLRVDDGYDRFKECGWPLAFETEITKAIFMPVLAHHYRMRRPGISEPIDRLLRERWWDCLNVYLWATRQAREAKRHAHALDSRWRATPCSVPSPPGILAELERALRRSFPPGRCDVGVMVAGRSFLASETYIPVLRALQKLGLRIIWVELVDEVAGPADRAGVSSREHLWGLELRVPLPSPEELAGTDPKAADRYGGLLDQFREGFQSLPPEWRWIGHYVRAGLPISAHRWLAASAVAQRLLDDVPVRFVHVLLDKDVAARSFILAARAKRVETSYYYSTLELGAPAYWPLADRILVVNSARAERLRDLAVPRERIVTVGSLEVDRILEAARAARWEHRPHQPVNALLLTKWPAPLFFGDPDRIGELLSEMVRLAPRWHWIVKPHPRDTTDYGRLSAEHPDHVEVRRTAYVELMTRADLVISAMGNPVFHALAVGKPLVVFNPNKKINLGHDRLFSRTDLPPQIQLVKSWVGLRNVLREFAGGDLPLTAYNISASMSSYLFHALDGTTAERVSAVIAGLNMPASDEPGAPQVSFSGPVLVDARDQNLK